MNLSVVTIVGFVTFSLATGTSALAEPESEHQRRDRIAEINDNEKDVGPQAEPVGDKPMRQEDDNAAEKEIDSKARDKPSHDLPDQPAIPPSEHSQEATKDGNNLLTKSKTNAGFIHSFVATLSVITVSEIGDKTFFIAAILAMRNRRLTVFSGAMAALGLMHVFSALFGSLATVIPRRLTFYLSSSLFAIFGLKMLREGWHMSPDEGQEEYEETQAELKKYEDEQLQAHSMVVQDPETGIVRIPGRQLQCVRFLSPLFVQSASLTFLAEWGDRSQIAAIILAARENVIGVIIGGLLGHFLCTGLAVLGGRFIAQRISVRTVTLIGGVVFLIFAVSAFFVDPTVA